MIMHEFDVRFIYDRSLISKLIIQIERWNKERKLLEEDQTRFIYKRNYDKHLEIMDRLEKLRNYLTEAFIKIGDIFKRYEAHPLKSELLKNYEYESQN